jgi:DNA polymerase (family 10)
VCSVHYKFNLPRGKQTERILRAMDNPYFNVLAHPSGRLINEREPYDVDMEKIMEAAKARNCFLEVNSQPDRLDLTDDACRLARDIGVGLVISTDAHSTSDLALMRLGVGQARRGWIEAGEVLNTRPLQELRKLLQRH